MSVQDWQNGGFGVYIHWPFCQAKCPYCDFNSHVAQQIDQQRWLNAYIAEIDRIAALVPGRTLNTVFFGGGTPSLMQPEIVAGILERLFMRWNAANDIEITLEANPTSAESGRFAAYAQAGVTRLSLGLQALNDTDLRRLGRVHSAEEGRSAFEMASRHFSRTSFDLIYARQNQSPAEWRKELADALALAGDHLSLYQLTIEDGTVFGARHAAGKLPGLPDEDSAAEMFEITQDLCDAKGMRAYEVSNHARAGAESRHNLIYWCYGDYAGIGPGAHGRLTIDGKRHATAAISAPASWLERATSGGESDEITPISAQEQAGEYLMMSLRLTEGTDLQRHAALAGQRLSAGRIQALEEMGMVRLEGTRLIATNNGRALLNAILRDLMA